MREADQLGLIRFSEHTALGGGQHVYVEASRLKVV